MPATSPRTPRRTARTPSVDVRGALIDAAEAVVVRDGVDSLTVRNVAVAAGVAPMGVYNHLGGKDGLIEALLIRGFDRLRTTIEDGKESDPIQRLVECGRRYREFAHANPQIYSMMFEGAVAFDKEQGELREHSTAAFGALVDKIAYAIDRGALRNDDAVDLAYRVWSCVHGAVSLELHGMTVVPDPPSTYRALLSQLIDGARP